MLYSGDLVEKDTRAISSVFYTLPFYASLKQLKRKEDTASDEQLFSVLRWKKPPVSRRQKQKFHEFQETENQTEYFFQFPQKEAFFIP